MIEYINGDLIDLFKSGKFDAIAHQCNCFCTMGAGLALRIAREFPEVARADKDTLKGTRSKLGTISLADTPYGKVFNVYGQYRYGCNIRHTDYPALEKGLIAVCRYMIRTSTDVPTIGLPLIGCGLAGGDWRIVGDIVRRSFSDCNVFVVHQHTKG